MIQRETKAPAMSKEWCADQGMGRPGTKATFGLANARGKHERDLAGRDLPRLQLYRGIRRKTAAEREVGE